MEDFQERVGARGKNGVDFLKKIRKKLIQKKWAKRKHKHLTFLFWHGRMVLIEIKESEVLNGHQN